MVQIVPIRILRQETNSKGIKLKKLIPEKVPILYLPCSTLGHKVDEFDIIYKANLMIK